MAIKTFHCYNNYKHREQRNTSSFHVFYLKSFVTSTLDLVNILNTVVCSGLRLHPIRLENSKSTGLLEEEEVRSLPNNVRTPEIKTWLLLKAVHTPFFKGTELTRTAPLTSLPMLPSGSNRNQRIATVALCIIMVIMAVWEALELVTTKPTKTQRGLGLSSVWLFFTLSAPKPVTALHRH